MVCSPQPEAEGCVSPSAWPSSWAVTFSTSNLPASPLVDQLKALLKVMVKRRMRLVESYSIRVEASVVAPDNAPTRNSFVLAASVRNEKVVPA